MRLRRRRPRVERFVLELEAANVEGPPPLEEIARRFGVTAREVDDGGRYGWPIYQYEGTRADLVAFLADQYDDGSGETADELFDRCNPVRVAS